MKTKEIELVLIPPKETITNEDEAAIEIAKLIYYLTFCD